MTATETTRPIRFGDRLGNGIVVDAGSGDPKDTTNPVRMLVGYGEHAKVTSVYPWMECWGDHARRNKDNMHRAARAIFAFLGGRRGAHVVGYDLELVGLAQRLIVESWAVECPHGDRFCPCQDDGPSACHYEGVEPAPCPRSRVVGCDCRAAVA